MLTRRTPFARRSRSTRARRGATLVELIVAMAITGVVVALTVAVAARLERQLASLIARARSDERGGDGAAVLAMALRPLTPSVDLTAAQRSDTVLQLQSAVADGIACGRRGDLVLAVLSGRGARRVQAGDTVRALLGDPVTSMGWRAAAVTSLAAVSGACAALVASPEASRLHNATQLQAIAVAEPARFPDSAALAGAPVRVTRPEREVLYRAADGAWYLGIRTWQASGGTFATVQPVSGPYLREPAARSRFAYFDAAGALLDADAAAEAIARIEAVLIVAREGQRRDTQTLIIAPRGR